MAKLIIASIDNDSENGDVTSDNHVVVGQFKSMRSVIAAIMETGACHTENNLWTIEASEAIKAGIISKFKNKRNDDTFLVLHVVNAPHIYINENKWTNKKFSI